MMNASNIYSITSDSLLWFCFSQFSHLTKGGRANCPSLGVLTLWHQYEGSPPWLCFLDQQTVGSWQGRQGTSSRCSNTWCHKAFLGGKCATSHFLGLWFMSCSDAFGFMLSHVFRGPLRPLERSCRMFLFIGCILIPFPAICGCLFVNVWTNKPNTNDDDFTTINKRQSTTMFYVATCTTPKTS